MKVSDTDVRTGVLNIYAECRQAPGADFDEGRFLAYLVEPPARSGEIQDSFASNRRFVRFMNRVQTEFSVYFSMKDWETNFSLDRFARRISYLRDNPEGSLRSLRNAMATSSSNAVIVANVLLVSFAMMSWNIKWLFALLVACWIGANGWMVWFFRRERKYQQAMLRQIEELKAERAGSS